MGITLYFILLLTFLLSVFIIYKTVYNRKKISCMAGMMIAMTLGMSVGLLLGVIFGILFSDNFFVATIFGMMAGIASGFLAGVPISIMAVLDGLLSGLMGGMMGSMLGAMIATGYHEAIVKTMFFLFLATVLILIYMMENEANKKEKSFYRNPLISVALFGFLFFVFNQTGPIFTGTASYEQNHSENNQNNKELLIEAKEYDFLPNDIKVKVGQPVTLSISNTDTIEHDLEIINFNPQNIKQNPSHNHQTENTIHLHVEPGENQTVSFIPAEKGVYRFICTIPGHMESGMFGMMEVL